ncbi:MAG: flippase-like domain-containing protein [Clostridia bacterium]|nr:flippase-like domain-containing protein [Clostridia bacterium]
MKGGKRRILNIALILGTLAIVLVIGISDNSLGHAIEYVRSMNLGWVCLAILCYLAFLAMDAVAIHFFLKRQGYKVYFGRLAFTSIAGQYYSNITPGAYGGQPMQIYYLHKSDVPTAIGTSAISMRFFCFQVMLSVFATVLWIRYGTYVNEHVAGQRWILIIGYCYNAVMVAGVATLALQSGLIKRLIAWGIRFGTKHHWIKKPEEISEKLNKSVDVFHDSLTSYSHKPWDMLVQLFIGGLQLLALMSVLYCVYRGLGLVGESYWRIVTMNVMEYISAAYAPLPGASGAQEGVFSMYFDHIFPDGMLFAALLLWRFFTYYICLILGAVVVTVHGLREGKSLRDVARQGNQVIEGDAEISETADN